MIFVLAMVLVVTAVLGVWANARSRRQMEALNERPDDMKRADENEEPPSFGGPLGPVD